MQIVFENLKLIACVLFVCEELHTDVVNCFIRPNRHSARTEVSHNCKKKIYGKVTSIYEPQKKKSKQCDVVAARNRSGFRLYRQTDGTSIVEEFTCKLWDQEHKRIVLYPRALYKTGFQAT